MAKKQKVSIIDGILRVEYPTINKVFTADTQKYPPIIQHCAKDHGFKQKYGDAASGGTPTEKYAEVQAIHESLMNGEWERNATPDLTPIICEAIARLQQKPLDKVRKAAEKAGATKVKEWGSNPRVKAEILKIKAEKLVKLAEAVNEDFNIDV